MSDLIIIGKHYYCQYCGQEISKDENGQYVCHCEDASKARQIEREAMQLEWSARTLRNSKPKPRYCERTVCAPIPDTVHKTISYNTNASNTVWEGSPDSFPEE